MASILPANLDYTDRDFDSIRLRLENLLRGVFPDWTDFTVANFGNILLELNAFVGDVLGLYENNSGQESRITTATQRKTIIGLAKLIGFIPKNNTAATADLAVTLDSPPIDDFNLLAGQVVRTQSVTEPVEFQLLTPLTIPAGANPPTATVPVENSETRTEDFQSDGLPNQSFELTNIPYIDESAAVVAANGVYEQVRNFLSSSSSDRHFTVSVDQNDRSTIQFGNGVNGEIPVGAITVDYKTGGGEVGNVEAGDINVIEGTFTDDSSNPVTVSVTNTQKASGGTERQNIEQIRVLAPEQLRVLNRTVAREDYEINARRLPEVARALMLTADQIGIPENTGILWVIPAGGGNPSQTLKDAVINQVTVVFPKTLTFKVEVRDPVFLTLNFQIRVARASGFPQETVRSNIESALEQRFALFNEDGTENEDVDFGFNIKDADGNPAGFVPWSRLLAQVQGVDGVAKIGDGPNDFAINGVDDDVPILDLEFPQLGTITLIDADSGEFF